jgi:hypothetical protein
MWRPLLTLSALVVSAPLLAIEVPQAPHLVVSGYAEQKAEPDMLTLNVAVTALEKQGIKAKQKVDTKVAPPSTSIPRTSSPRWWAIVPSVSWRSSSISSTSSAS